MQVPKRSARLAAAAAVLALTITPGAGLAASTHTDTATGHVGPDASHDYTLDFSARSTSTGNQPRGSARLKFNFGQEYSGDITCLRVEGATQTTPAIATMWVEVTRSTPGSSVRSFLIAASDSGKFSGAPDMANWLTLTSAPAPDVCPDVAPFSPVANGEVTITNALP